MEKVNHPAPKGAQRVMFEKIATGDCSPSGAASTRRALVEKGLIKQIGFSHIGRPPFQVKIPQFEVPIHIHMQWCEWCATGVAKAAKVAAFVRMLVEGGEQVLLGGWHRDVYDIWQDHLSDLGIVFYTGSESQSRKIKAKAAFVSGQARIMAMSLRSGAGLDGLQHCCRTVVFGELDWSPMVHRQFIGRVRRPGQTETVDTYYLNTDGGSDPAIVETLGLKSSQAHGIIDPFADTSSPNIEPDVSRITRLAKQLLRNQ